MQNLGNVDVDRLVGAAQGGEEVGDLLAAIHHVNAQELEGNDARLAVGCLVQGAQDERLVERGLDVDPVDAGAKDKVVDGEVADIEVIRKVGKCGVALLPGD